MLTSLLREMGYYSVLDLGSVADDPEAVITAFQKASQLCDILISSGGVSMGELDFVKPILAEHGTVFFGRLNMKPGKPTTFGRIGDCLVFGLPGNPVSSLVTC